MTSEPLLKAAEILRECNRQDLRKLPDDVPLDFVPAAWRPHVCPEGVSPVTNFDDLMGDFWPEDEPADEFISTVKEWRHEGDK